MPRLPTIRVIGSQDISTSSLPVVACLLGAGWVVVIGAALSDQSPMGMIRALPGAGGARAELRAALAPLGLLIDGVRGDLPQSADGVAVQPDRSGGELAAGRFVHERH